LTKAKKGHLDLEKQFQLVVVIGKQKKPEATYPGYLVVLAG
jgi:hypothetical protein